MKKLVLIICALSFIACADEEMSPTPDLTFLSISPSNVTANQDSVVIKFSYQDGDGDLGENGEDLKNLFVQDSRNQVVYEYRVQQLAPSGSTIPITGELDVLINNTTLVNGSTAESVSYSIWMFDRSGNRSNTINTSSITINP